MRRPYDVSLPLLTPMHYVHLVHGCAFVKWIGMRTDSGVRRICVCVCVCTCIGASVGIQFLDCNIVKRGVLNTYPRDS